MTLRRDNSLGAEKPRRAKPVVAVTVGLAVCTLVACGGGDKTATLCPTTGKQVTFRLLDKSKTYTVDVRTNFGAFGNAVCSRRETVKPAVSIADSVRHETV